jgi:hypothetical protein
MRAHIGHGNCCHDNLPLWHMNHPLPRPLPLATSQAAAGGGLAMIQPRQPLTA